MMNTKEVSRELFSGIEQRIMKYGFSFISSKNIFKREINEFTHIFDLLFTEKKECIYVEPVIRLKSTRIEKIYHKVVQKESKYFFGTKSLGNNLFKIEKHFEEKIDSDIDEKQQYIIEDEKDIEILIKVISEKFEKYAIKYFDEYSSVEKIDWLLNKNPTDISIHNWLYPVRACIGIIAAKLNNNPNYEELKSIYKEEMNEAVEPYKREFFKLINEIL